MTKVWALSEMVRPIIQGKPINILFVIGLIVLLMPIITNTIRRKPIDKYTKDVSDDTKYLGKIGERGDDLTEEDQSDDDKNYHSYKKCKKFDSKGELKADGKYIKMFVGNRGRGYIKRVIDPEDSDKCAYGLSYSIPAMKTPFTDYAECLCEMDSETIPVHKTIFNSPPLTSLRKYF